MTIEFWAKLLTGNIGYNEVSVEKVEKKEEEPTILGLSLIINF
ncbi:MAG: hypothetical protein ACFE9T_16360 [Promethearchaeota archaeon]